MSHKILAWCIHFYTSLGLIAAAFSTVFIVLGGDDNLRTAIIFLFAAMAIDASDGYLARMVRVDEVTPAFDGRRLDDIIDFHTFTTIPVLLIWQSGLLSGGMEWILLFPLLASAYGFSQSNAKTPDGYFLGFPSYWNVVAFYLFFLQPALWLSVSIIALLSVFTFIPSKYLHPSLPGSLSRITVILGIIWAIMVLSIIVGLADDYNLVFISLAYPVYYVAASWVVTIRDWTDHKNV